ncbi:aspartic peptidase domain-containing protein [Pilobolus umbonatus]|nr:aspartic peptidase domain-containing protein [Pilobolus umbonatus]
MKKRETHGTGLYNSGSSYYIQVSIGTPPQNFEMILDTGSADLWVPGSSCPVTVCPLHKFNEAASSTYKPTTEAFEIQYGIGYAEGIHGRDTVTIANTSIEQQLFGVASNSSNIFTDINTIYGVTVHQELNTTATDYSSDNNLDGVFGLAFPFLTSNIFDTYPTFFFNLIQQNRLDQNLFSIYLSQRPDLGDTGEIIFGGMDHSKYTGQITYVPLATTSNGYTEDYGFWQVHGQGIEVEQGFLSDLHIPFKTTLPFMFDTGTTFTYLPAEVIDTILYAAVGPENAGKSSTGFYSIRCNAKNLNTRLNLHFSISSRVVSNPVVLSIPMSELLVPLNADRLEDATQCLFGVLPTEGRMIIGQSILRSIYTVYGVDEHVIGMATAVHSKTTIVGTGVNVSISNQNNNQTTEQPDQSSALSLVSSFYSITLSCLFLFMIL